MKILTIILAILSFSSFAKSAKASRSMASLRRAQRVEHARELMGDRYHKSVVSQFETRKDIEKNIFHVVNKCLPKAFKIKAREVSRTIIEESSKHSLDPYFVMAVISGESSFNPDAIGPVGEIGLMQIRPSTGQWIAELTKAKWSGEKTLRDPTKNIKLGIAYLAWLRNKFQGHGQLYVAAYNMGHKSVKNAVSRNVFPKDYPIHVMKRYIAFYKDIGSQRGTL
jgi:soluble lytic murein transglycosylase